MKLRLLRDSRQAPMRLLPFVVALGLAPNAVSCGSGCDDTFKTTTVMLVDADTLDPVCGFLDPKPPWQQSCLAVWGANTNPDGEAQVSFTADGYRDQTATISPLRYDSCGVSGGCNLVYMVRK